MISTHYHLMVHTNHKIFPTPQRAGSSDVIMIFITPLADQYLLHHAMTTDHKQTNKLNMCNHKLGFSYHFMAILSVPCCIL